ILSPSLNRFFLHLSMASSSRLSFSSHNLKRDESDFIVECGIEYKETIVDLRMERTPKANAARQLVWETVVRQFESRFGKKISEVNAKTNFKYRQKILKNDKEKCKILAQWMDDPSSITEEQMEELVGKVDLLLFKMHPQGILTERNGDEWENVFDSVNGIGEGTPNGQEEIVGVLKEEEEDPFHDHSQSHEQFPHIQPNTSRLDEMAAQLPSSSFSDEIPRKRLRIHEGEPIPSFAPPSSEKEYLELELLKAKIELTKSKQIAVDKQIQSNTAMIMVMDRLMNRIETKRDEPEQSAMMNLITIMKDMVKK
ncbi:hypothetical protein PENTCL1PPCAC_17587, partial [Pristionchus entomophagus]